MRTSIATAQVAPVETTGGEATALAVGVALLLLLVFVLWWQKTLRSGGPGQPGQASQPGRDRHAAAGRQPGRASGRSLGARDRTADEPTPDEMDAQAARALVETDNAVRTSEQELGFAVARFGEHAAAQFSRALASAREELAGAFRLRQHLDDTAEPPRVRQSILAQIAAQCAEANRLLEEQAEDFDRLQDFQAHVPQLLPEVENHIKQQEARIGGAHDMVRHLADRYTSGAVTIVAAGPAHATEQLDAANEASTGARQAVAAGDTRAAADRLEVAELSADQAESMLDSIGHLEAELTRASSALPAALREIDADVAESAEVVGRQDDRRAPAVARAQSTAGTVRGLMAAGTPLDPLAALRELQQASSTLDEALASARSEQDRQEHARGVLDQAMLVARSSVKVADDFVSTRRSDVGATARTRLAEARRHYLEGVTAAQADPETALAQAQNADSLALAAQSLAEQDVQDSGAESPGDAAANGVGFGGPAARDRRELAGLR